MMNLNVSFQLKMKLRGKCPVHPRYNPNLGEGAIRGGCPHCRALFAVTHAADRLYEAAAALDSLAQPYLIGRRSRSKPPAA